LAVATLYEKVHIRCSSALNQSRGFRAGVVHNEQYAMPSRHVTTALIGLASTTNASTLQLIGYVLEMHIRFTINTEKISVSLEIHI
jgi:hypothetical protein